MGAALSTAGPGLATHAELALAMSAVAGLVAVYVLLSSLRCAQRLA